MAQLSVCVKRMFVSLKLAGVIRLGLLAQHELVRLSKRGRG